MSRVEGKAVVFAVLWVLLGAVAILLGDKIIPLGEPTSSAYVANYIKIVGVALTLLTGGASIIVPLIFAASTEAEKRRATVRVDAFPELYKAMRRGYQVMQRLESSSWTPDSWRELESNRAENEGHLVYVNDVAAAAWDSFWQEANRLSESAFKLSGTEGQKALWREGVKTLAEHMEVLKAEASG